LAATVLRHRRVISCGISLCGSELVIDLSHAPQDDKIGHIRVQ
jgi:hypothetical protein